MKKSTTTQSLWTKVLRKSLFFFSTFLFLTLFTNISQAQIIAWDFNGNDGDEATVNAATNDANLETSTISRGAGADATGLMNAYSSNNWDAANLADAKTNNEYYEFTIQASAGYVISLSSLDVNFRRTSTGPNKFQWEYSLDAFATAGTAIETEITYSGTETNGLAQTQIDLSGIADLQNTPNGTTLTFRVYAYGASSGAGTFAIGRLAGNDLAVGGSVNAANPTAFTATPSNESIILNWTNAAFSDEVLIVATSSPFTSVIPTGDGSTFTADADFTGIGTSFDGGKVVYKGSLETAIITGLTNETFYNFKIFNRIATVWSTGELIPGTPEANIFETFSDINLTDNPMWSGDTGDWTIEQDSDVALGSVGSQTLRLNASSAGTTQLRTQIGSWGGEQEWGFFLGRRSQAYTTGDRVYVWLYANEEDLESATVDGYRIAIGDDDADDEIVLESVTDGVGTAVITGAAINNGLTDIGLLIRVTRNASGDWQLFTSTLPTSNGQGASATDKPNATNANVNQGSATNTDHSIVTNGYFGILAVHSATSNTVEFDQIYLDFQIPNPMAFTATPADGSIILNWTNVTPSDEVLIVASTSSIDANPMGDGSAYMADANFLGAGTAFDGGKVVYKGTDATVTITGLTNETAYNFKIFNREGTIWSSGEAIMGTPEAILETFIDNDFTNNPIWSGDTGDWTIEENSDVAADATGSKTLRLNASTAGMTQLRTQVVDWEEAQEWGFFLGRRSQAYTAGDKVYVWLHANEEDLESATVDGYRIAIGDDDADDEIVLESVTDGVGTAIITSTTPIPDGLTDIGLLFRVTRNASGDWQLFTSAIPTSNGEGALATDKPNAANTTVDQGTANNRDHNIIANGYLGIVAIHSAASDVVEFDQIYLSLLESPKVTAFNPVDDATGVVGSTNLEITFDREIVKGEGDIHIRKVIDGESVETIVVTDATVTVVGNMVTIDPVSDLAAGVEFHLEIPNTAFQDANASFNTYVGISDNTTWNFKIDRETLVAWDFPDASADAEEDMAITANDGKELSTTGGLGALSFAVPGVTEKSAGTDNWTGGVNTKAWQVEFVTTDYDEIKVSSKQRSASGAPQNFKLQYSLDGTDWLDVENSTVTVIDDWTTGVLTEVALPQEASHQPSVFLRWVMTSDASSATANSYIDDIVITGREDIINPTNTVFAPEDDAVSVPVNTNLEITFTEPVTKGTGNIIVKQSSDDATVETVAVTSNQVIVEGNKVTVNLPNDFENDGRGYYVEIPNTAFDDNGGQDYRGISNKNTWNFNTVDEVGPEVTNFNPNDNANEVNIATNLEVTFNEDIKKGTGNVEIRKRSDDVVVETIAVTAANVTVSGNEMIIDPSSDLELDTEYYITIATGTVLDNFDNPFAGIANRNTWNFHTTDGNPPVVTQFNPEDNTSDVDPSVDFRITFDERVNEGVGNIRLVDDTDGSGDETLPIGSSRIDFTRNRRTIIIDFPGDLVKGHQFHIEIDAGAVKDDQDNDFAGITDATTWNFIAANRPYVVTFTPDDDELDVAIDANLTIEFDEDIAIGTGNLIIRDENDNDISIDVTDDAQVTVAGTTVTIDPTDDLAVNTNYHVRIPEGAFESATSGELYRGINNNEDWNFKTLDNVAPLLVSFTPTDGATGVLTDDELQLEFNEEVKRGTGNITIVNENDNTKNIIIDVTTPANQIDMNDTDGDRFVTIRPTGGLDHSTKYHVLIDAGAFEDISTAQNDFTGITDDVTWNFETVDLAPPTVTAFVPADNFSNAEINADLQIIFDENVQKGATGNIIITDGTTPIVIPVTDAQVTVTDNTVTINPSNDLKQNVLYYVQIDNGAIQDISGNDYIGIIDNTTWDFTTGGASFSPLDDAVDVLLDENLVMTFNKEVKAGTGNFNIVDETGGGANTLTIAITDETQVSFSGNQIIVNPTDYLQNNNAYHIEIDATAIDFLTGEDYEGITDATTWNFATVNDVTAPTLTAKIPDAGATDVLLGQDIVLTFDESVRGQTGGQITLSGDGVTGTPLVLNVDDDQVTFAGNMVVINLTTPFVNDNKTVTVDIPNTAISDLAGNAFAGDNWSFTTANDIIAPTFVSSSPTDTDTEVLLDADIVITFDEEIQAGTGNITITDNGDASDNRTIAVNDAQITYEGASLIIGLTTDLENNTNYSINLPIGGVQDLAGNMTTAAVDFSFTTVNDGTAPTAEVFSPEDNATEINLDVTLQLTFSENIKTGTGNITLREDGGSTTSYDVTSAPEVTIAGNTLIIQPNADLFDSKTYEVGIDGTAITDIAGNAFAGFNNTSGTWNFDTRDLTAPIVNTYNPADDASNIMVGNNLILTFSENIVEGAGNITIKGGSSDIIIPISDGQVSVATNTLTINPTEDLEQDTDYHILLDAGIVEDAFGNAYAGIPDATTWNFQTEADVTPPTITSLSPADGGTSIAVNSDLVITFDEPIQKGSGNITITDGTSPVVIAVTSAEVTIEADEQTVIINPIADLAQSTEYYVNIDAGTFQDKASTPNDFAGILDNTTWNFITIDAVGPTLSSFTPTDEATNVALTENLEMTFSENVQAGSGNITIKGGTTDIVMDVTSGQVNFSDNQVIVNPAADLEEGVTYHVEITNGAIQDLSGNNFGGILDNVTWNFTTVSDGIAPTITSLNPMDEATNVVLNSNFEITFSEPVVAGTGDFVLEGGSSTINISADDATQVTFSGNVVTINPTVDLEGSTAYNIKVQSTAVKDASDNFFEGILDATTWNFTSAGDNINPVISIFSPANGETEVATASNLEITFSEDVQKGGAGNITLTPSGGGAPIVKSVTSGDVTVNNNIVTVTNLGLSHTEQYTVTIDAGAFQDVSASNNPFAGISGTTWQFTTVDQTAPTIMTLSPSDEAIDVEPGSNLVITFDENIQAGVGNISITGGASPIDIPVTDAQVLISGNIVTIDPTNFLSGATTYTVTIPSGVFKDVSPSENDFTGTTAGQWNFQTGTATLTVTADNLSRPFGDANPSLTLTYSGFDTGDDESVIDTPPTATTTADINSVPGAYPITVSGGTDDKYTFDYVAGTLTVTKANQTITFGGLPTQAVGNPNFDLTATASSGLEVTYTSSNPAVATVSGKTVTIVGGGSTTITASQAGNDNYNEAPDVTQTLIIDSNTNGGGSGGTIGPDIIGEMSGDRLGQSVAISADGSVLVTGAIGNDGNGESAGHARVLVWNGTNWIPRGADIDGEDEGDQAGSSVAISSDGNTIAVGANWNDGTDVEAGHVRIYNWNGTAWTQRGADLDGEAANDQFGTSVSLSADGNIIAVGALWNDAAGIDAGHVRVFAWDGTAWIQRGTDLDGEALGDEFGVSVSLSADGNTLAVGADLNDGTSVASGQAKVYTWNGSNWSQLGASINGETAGDLSGYSVSLSADGSTIAVGAPLNDGNGNNSGQVRVYNWNGSSWVQRGGDIDGESDDDRFGWSVSISGDGNVLVVGAPLNDGVGSDAGQARIFAWDGTNWQKSGTDIDGEAINDQAGFAVTISSNGSTVAVGSPLNDGNGQDAGHVRVYNDIVGFGSNTISSLEDLIDENISVYPNPTTAKVIVEGFLGEVDFTLIDMQGKEILTGQAANTFEVDLTTVQTGVYTLVFEIKGETFSRKVIKE